MKTAVFSTREYDRQFLDEANRKFKHELIYHAEVCAVPPRRWQQGVLQFALSWTISSMAPRSPCLPRAAPD